MSKISKCLFTMSFISFISNCDYAQNVITFFVRPLKKEVKPIEKLFWGINKKIITKKSNHVHKHLFATYYGYLTISNEFDQIILPRRSSKAKFNILITNKIEPILMFPNTISHWNIPVNTQAKLYQVERISEDKLNYTWKVSTVTTPKDRKIGIQTIVLFAKPKNLLIPTGTFKTVKGRQLLLPDVYMKKDFHDADIALFISNISKFFRPAEQDMNQANNTSSYLKI